MAIVLTYKSHHQLRLYVPRYDLPEIQLPHQLALKASLQFYPFLHLPTGIQLQLYFSLPEFSFYVNCMKMINWAMTFTIFRISSNARTYIFNPKLTRFLYRFST